MPGPERSFDENEVIDVALLAFWKHGYEGTSLTTVLDQVGIGRQSLYNAFESKQALYLAALRRYRAERIQGIIDILEGPGSPRARLDMVFDAVEAKASAGECAGCFVANAIVDFGRTNDEVLGEIERSCALMTSAFARVLEEARAAGEIPTTLVPDEVAPLCMTLVEGVSLLNRAQPDAALAGAVRRGLRSLLAT